MKLSEVQQEIVNIPPEQQKAILKLIDIKIESDMEKVLHSLDNFNKTIEHTNKTIDNLRQEMERNTKIVLALITLLISVVIALKIFG